MASNADPKRIAILVLLLVAFAAVAVYRLRPALVPSVAVIGALVVLVSLKHLVTRVLRTGPVSSRHPYTDSSPPSRS